jgi:hypothetical protein
MCNYGLSKWQILYNYRIHQLSYHDLIITLCDFENHDGFIMISF